MAALGGGAAVYTGLASAEQRRDVRNRILDRLLDDHVVRVCEASVAAITHEQAAADPDGSDRWSPISEFRNLNERPAKFLELAVERVGSASRFSARASRYDAWQLQRLYSRARDAMSDAGAKDAETAALAVVTAKEFLERRLRNPRWYSPSYMASAIFTRRRLSQYAKHAKLWTGAGVDEIMYAYRDLPQPKLRPVLTLNDDRPSNQEE